MERGDRENRPIIALDFPSLDLVTAFFSKFPTHEELFVKVGMELFYSEGLAIIDLIKERGYLLFLDLKLHDIPNTVFSAVSSLAKYGIDLMTIHAAGGIKMMQEAKKAVDTDTPSGIRKPNLLAVTQLTSTDEEMVQNEQLLRVNLEDSVINYAKNAQKSGMFGVICSALEVEKIKAATDPNFACITPGIRPLNSSASDQKRVVTPHKAYLLGSNAIVVGRPITKASDPYTAYLKIKEEFSK